MISETSGMDRVQPGGKSGAGGGKVGFGDAISPDWDI